MTLFDYMYIQEYTAG